MHRVIDTQRSFVEVARELSDNEMPLGNWVPDERRRLVRSMRVTSLCYDHAPRNRFYRFFEHEY